jgi:nicotinate-nucleotide--dimethylbenzimidazole phosphoribosyltransferase
VDEDLTDYKGIIHKKIRRGTDNITKGPAMTREEAITAINIGIETVGQLKEKGYNLIGTGEMGIGNTTTSSAIASVLLEFHPSLVVGSGAGLSKEGLLNKISVVERAIKFNKPIKADPIDVISKVGGFDIAGLVGCFIGGAIYRLPIIIDGFISSVAALCAVTIEPKVKDYIFPSHASAEQAGYKILDALGLEPMLLLDMRLGEGTCAAIAFGIFDAAFVAYTKMGTFDDAAIEQYKPQN